ncbi:hypothetical protein [Paraburkholderia sp. GAS348]|uniref:hypothetical protein n=1 Tax=Paraburkholderia sp. GAS348 TaxID=3035132 RepID=UPI003D2021A5
MSQLDYINDLAEFTRLWDRANAGVRLLANVPREELLYFDPFDIATPKFFELLQANTFTIISENIRGSFMRETTRMSSSSIS